MRNGVTPVKLARAYNRLWDGLQYGGDRGRREGTSRASRQLRKLEDEVERLEDGVPDSSANTARLVHATERYEDAQRAMRGACPEGQSFLFRHGS